MSATAPHPWAKLCWTQSTSDLVIRMMRICVFFLLEILSYFNVNAGMMICDVLSVTFQSCDVKCLNTSTWLLGLVTGHACCNIFVMTWERRFHWTGTRQHSGHATCGDMQGQMPNLLVLVGQSESENDPKWENVLLFHNIMSRYKSPSHHKPWLFNLDYPGPNHHQHLNPEDNQLNTVEVIKYTINHDTSIYQPMEFPWISITELLETAI